LPSPGMSSRIITRGILSASLLVACTAAPLAFVAAPGSGSPYKPQHIVQRGNSASLRGSDEEATAESTGSSSAASLLLGACLGLCVALTGAGSARALDLSEAPIPFDDKGKTTVLTPEQLVRGKRLFNAACAQCHGGGSTKTNQTVSLDTEALKGAIPPRDNVLSMVDYLKNPTTYDGVTDIRELHPATSAGDIWPKMRSMKEKDLVDITSYVMYMNQTVLEKWGGGKMYF